tara:strand:+ start:287 stop:1036 length:750 start_codon:yes stop_codon:yes gene_type:complete
MSIIFYSMGSRCGYCVKAEALLRPQIENGEIVKKPVSEAGGKFNGFPAFESKKTGKTSMGCPKSYEHLTKKLGHVEHYHEKEHNLLTASLFSCDPPPVGMSPTTCCEVGGRTGGIGQCPSGCVDNQGGECVPSGDGSNVKGPHPCPTDGNVVCNIGGVCEETGLERGGKNMCIGGCWSPISEDTIKACNNYGGGGGSNLVKGEGEGEGEGKNKGSKKKRQSALEIVIIVMALLGLMGIVAYLVKKIIHK